jgi:RHS repeat-associated protein
MDASFSELLVRVAEVFVRGLANEPPAREWLASKGVSDAALLDRFGVGWAGGTLRSMARGEVAGRLRTLGLLDAEGKDRFAGCVVVPVRDPQGNIAQMAAYASDGTLSWLFPEETPSFWNAEGLKGSAEVLIVPDPLAGLIEIAGGREGVIALGGAGKPLGQGAKDLLLAHAPKVELKGCEFLKAELEALGIRVRGKNEVGHEAAIEQDENGFAAQFPRRLRFVVQGVSQDSHRHLRASVRVLRQAVEGSSTPSRTHLDTLDLYHARSRIGFAKTAACLLGEDPIVMEEHLSRVVTLAEEFLRKRVEAPPAVVLTDSDREEALALLRDPRYPECLAEDLTRMGYVGEEANKQVAYLASISRKLEEPLSILVVSRSASGKSTLSEAIAGLAPAEDVLRFTRLTGQKFDAESGLMYYKNRYHSQDLGRFVSRDVLAMNSSAYEYVNARATKLVDPVGLMANSSTGSSTSSCQGKKPCCCCAEAINITAEEVTLKTPAGKVFTQGHDITVIFKAKKVQVDSGGGECTIEWWESVSNNLYGDVVPPIPPNTWTDLTKHPQFAPNFKPKPKGYKPKDGMREDYAVIDKDDCPGEWIRRDVDMGAKQPPGSPERWLWFRFVLNSAAGCESVCSKMSISKTALQVLDRPGVPPKFFQPALGYTE